MNDNESTIEKREATEPEVQEPDTPVVSKSPLSGRQGGRALTPPPPSAPGEFLEAQNHSGVFLPSTPVSPNPVTPPPPSVPTEFLDVQQWRDASSKGPAGLLEDFLKSGSPLPQEFETGVWSLQWPEEEPAQAEMEETAIEVDQPVLIRGVPLTRGEEITKVLLPDEGLSDALPTSGQALILTSSRLIAFRGVESFRDTHMARTSDLSQFSVRTGQRNWAAILQGLLMMVAGGFLYLVVGYWLAGQISGPNVPVLNIDVAPLIALLIILAGLLVLLQNYFTRPAGAVIFRGTGIEIAFPFRSALDVRQIYEFVDLVQKEAQRDGGVSDAETQQESPFPPGEG